MARLICLPVAWQIKSGTCLLYDGACGTGGMLTVSNNTFSNKGIKPLKETQKRAIDVPLVIKNLHKAKPDPLHGLFPTTLCGKAATVGYEPDPELRDTEQKSWYY